jgi:5-methylthioadenosine/S-adenosylhomocysteine deaminase
MKILIKNCNLISMSENREKYEPNMDILIEDNKIKRIEKNINEDCEKVINASGKVVMPGLINTHSHISMSIFRETVDGLKTQDWLTQKIWPMEDQLTNEDIYYATMLSCIEMIETGCTCINDMYFMTEDIIKATLESGVRLQTTRTLMGHNKEDLIRLDELNNLLENYKYETITFNAGIHGLYTSNEEYVKKCVDFAEEKNLPIHMHFCENTQEREDIKRDYNVEKPSDVIKRDFKGIHNILAHSVKISDKDIENLKETNTYISHCPVSNLKLGCGIAPITKMVEEGLCVSLGTDGQGSGSNLDMFETMKFTALLQKGINENPEDLPAYEVLKMATINGAKALKLNETGEIEEGKLADLIIINMEETITKPINNIFAEIVYNVKGSNVDTTIVNGKVLMENRKINNVNKKEIIQKCEKIIGRIKNVK